MNQTALRPATVCRALLSALEASEGRRRKRKRDQTPDSIGLALKRELLEQAVQADPDAEAFEGWLLNYAAARQLEGGVSAMARSLYEEWRLAHSMDEFRTWLDRGAPSDDAEEATIKDSPGRSAKGHL